MLAQHPVYRAKPNGLTIGITNGAGDVFSQLGHMSGVKFDVSKFEWIGRPDNDPVEIGVHKHSQYHSFDDLASLAGGSKGIEALAGGKGGFAYNSEVIIYNAFNIPFHMVAAFKGSHEKVATFLPGNGDTICLSASSMLQHLSDKTNIVLTISKHRIKQLPNVPTVMQEAKKHHLAKENVDALHTMIGVLSMGRAFFAPPGTPMNRLAALRSAFKKTISDPAAEKEAKKSGLFLGYAPPEELRADVRTALKHRTLLAKYLKTN